MTQPLILAPGGPHLRQRERETENVVNGTMKETDLVVEENMNKISDSCIPINAHPFQQESSSSLETSRPCSLSAASRHTEEQR